MLSSNGNTWTEDGIWVTLIHSSDVFDLRAASYLLSGYEPEPSPVEVDLLLQLLRWEKHAFAKGASGLQCRKGYVEDGALNVGIILYVEHKHCFSFGGKHICHPLKKEAEQGRKKALLGHVLQTHCDAVCQHVISDDSDTQRAQGNNTMDTIWEKEKTDTVFTYGKLWTTVKGNNSKKKCNIFKYWDTMSKHTTKTEEMHIKQL